LNPGRKITAWVIVIVTVLGSAYDVWVEQTYGSEATISWVTWTAAKAYPVIPLVFGIVAGHLFWVQQTGRKV
jgi:hypothetical protein